MKLGQDKMQIGKLGQFASCTSFFFFSSFGNNKWFPSSLWSFYALTSSTFFLNSVVTKEKERRIFPFSFGIFSSARFPAGCSQSAMPTHSLGRDFPSSILLWGLIFLVQDGERCQHFLWTKMLFPDHCLASNCLWTLKILHSFLLTPSNIKAPLCLRPLLWLLKQVETFNCHIPVFPLPLPSFPFTLSSC